MTLHQNMFDPYRKWLGILPKDQPPNHYRLLSVELFEDDLDVIEGAADRQMEFVRQYQSGEHAADAARILNELAVARLCLLKPGTKSAYDEKLRQQSAVARPEPEFPDGPLSSLDDMPTIPRKKTNSRRSQSVLSQQQMMVGGGIAVACVVVLIVLSRGSQQPGPKPIEPTTITGSTPTRQDVKPAPDVTEKSAVKRQPTQASNAPNTAIASVSSSTTPSAGSPLEASNSDTAPIVTSLGLVVLEAKMGANASWVDLTARLNQVAKSGRLVMVSSTGLIGSDPAFGTAKILKLRYKLDGQEAEQWFSENSVVQLESGLIPSSPPSNELVIQNALFGGGVFGEVSWTDVTDRTTAKVENGELNCPVKELIQNVATPNVNGPKTLFIRYSLGGQSQTTALFDRDTVDLGRMPARAAQKQSPGDRSKLVIVEARYGAPNAWVDFTERARKCAEQGFLFVKLDNTFVGGDPAPNRSKWAELRYRMHGRTYEQKYQEGSLIYLESGTKKPATATEKLEILDARWGLGVLTDSTWANVTNQVKARVDGNKIEVPVQDLIQNIPEPASGSKVLFVRYSTGSEIRSTFANEKAVFTLGN